MIGPLRAVNQSLSALSAPRIVIGNVIYEQNWDALMNRNELLIGHQEAWALDLLL